MKGPYISHVTGDKFSDVNRQPVGDHRLKADKTIAADDPHKPPTAICVNHEWLYGDLIARSDP